jgi:hypothetical protein
MTDIAQLTSLYDAWQAASSIAWYGRDIPACERAIARRACTTASHKWGAARRAACDEFAAQRGWKVSSKEFTFETLRAGRRPQRWECGRLYPVIDHADYFTQDGRPVAIVTHSYAPDEEVRLWAEAQRMLVEALPFSWYAPPRHCLAYVITRPDDHIETTNGVLINE